MVNKSLICVGEKLAYGHIYLFITILPWFPYLPMWASPSLLSSSTLPRQDEHWILDYPRSGVRIGNLTFQERFYDLPVVFGSREETDFLQLPYAEELVKKHLGIKEAENGTQNWEKWRAASKQTAGKSCRRKWQRTSMRYWWAWGWRGCGQPWRSRTSGRKPRGNGGSESLRASWRKLVTAPVSKRIACINGQCANYYSLCDAPGIFKVFVWFL